MIALGRAEAAIDFMAVAARLEVVPFQNNGQKGHLTGPRRGVGHAGRWRPSLRASGPVPGILSVMAWFQQLPPTSLGVMQGKAAQSSAISSCV
jgi:hypothetical protein